MLSLPVWHSGTMSLSSRRAWIEIIHGAYGKRGGAVALLAEGVDRNLCPKIACTAVVVALLAEGVDRNCISCNKYSGSLWVAHL